MKPNLLDVSDTPSAPAPAPFTAAVESIRAATMRQELAVTEIPAPGTLAPWSFALAADVSPTPHGSDSELGTGRFVLLGQIEASASFQVFDGRMIAAALAGSGW